MLVFYLVSKEGLSRNIEKQRQTSRQADGQTDVTFQQSARFHHIREWTGLEFAKSQRAVENRGKWRKLVVKSSVVV